MSKDIFISGDDSVINLELSDFEANSWLFIDNDENNPADTLFLITPKTDKVLEWRSKLQAKKLGLNLMVLLNNDTHIHDGSFKDFEHVMISNHRIIEQSNSSLLLDDDTSTSYKVKLIIDNFRTNRGLIFCSHLALIGGGIAKELLRIHLEDSAPHLKLIGVDNQERFTVGELQVNSDITKLVMDKVLVKKNFTHKNITNLFMENTLAEGDFLLTNIGNISKLELSSTGNDNQIYCDKIEVSNLFTPQGKFYISAKSYINFKIADNGRLFGIDLILDMSDSDLSMRKVIFPGCAFSFEQVKIIGASIVSIPMGGFCKELVFENCSKVMALNLTANTIKYGAKDQQGIFSCSSTKVGENLIVAGQVNITLYDFEAENVEVYGLCGINLSGNIQVKMLKVNLNLDIVNHNNTIPADAAVIRIDNSSGLKKIKIDTILAKLSTFHVKGTVQLGTVLICPIDKLSTLFWVEMTNTGSMLVDRLFVGGNHDIIITPDGSISVVRNKSMLTGSTVYASVSNATSRDYIYVEAGKGIRFDGKIHVINAVGLFTQEGDIIINGTVISGNSIMLAAKAGEVITTGSKLEAKAIAIYSHSSSYFHDTLIKAQELVIYSLNGLVQITKTQIKACNIAVIAGSDISIDASTVKSGDTYIKSAKNVNISNSEIISYSIFVQAIHDFLQVSSNIKLVQHPHVLFAEASPNTSIIKGGIKLATGVELIGIYSQGNHDQRSLTRLSWQQVANIDNVKLLAGNSYIEASRGFIIGSNLQASDSVVIRTSHSIEVVPLALYNEVIDSGGLDKKAIIQVISKINAGLINIEAGKTATFIGSILKAATGIINSDVISLLESPEFIKQQQERINALTGFIDLEYTTNPTVADYFNFSNSTSIAQRISNLSVYDNYNSPELYFTQKHGDIILDKSITKYEKLHIKAQHGSILITSPGLQNIYQGSAGGELGKQLAHNARTVIGGDEVYLIADEVVSHAGKFNVTGTLKIVAKDGVYLLPVSLHQSLFQHKGSKTTISEKEIRLVVSEINAGYLDIEAGGAFTAVSALIKATGVNLDVGELNLLSEREIFEKQVAFIGSDKWHGGYNESHDYFRHEIVIPTLIKTDHMNAKVNGKTTIEAAQILVAQESTLTTTGDVNILAKYDIHLHDHQSSKSYLFKLHDGKLTVAGTKTVREHFYGEASVPTIYYNHGDFYGYSEGRVHLLGSKIIANNLYLVAEKGIKLEAVALHEEQIVSFTEQGFRIGFSSNGGKHSFDAQFVTDNDKQQFKHTFHDVAELIARNNLIIESPQYLEMISSKLKFANAAIKVRGLHMHTHSNILETQHEHSSFNAGIHIGVQENISSTAHKVGHVLGKTGTHWLDILDRALNGYEAIEGIKDIYDDIEYLARGTNPDILKLKSVQFGMWAGISASNSTSNALGAKAVDNEIVGGDIDLDIVEDAIIEGIKCNVDNFSLKAKNLYATPGHDSSTYETYSSNIDISIPVAGSVGSSASAGYKQSESSSRSYHGDNIINVTGRLELNIAQDGAIKGIRLLADNVDINAGSLIIESLQDTLKERMHSMDLNIGVSAQGSKQFGVKAQMSQRDANWTRAIGSIIGREVVNIAVQQTLEIAGGLIANAEIKPDGSLSDKGKANVTAGKLIARQLHDFDDGHSYGIGVNLSKGIGQDGAVKYGVRTPLICSFNEKSRDILPTIGAGGINLTGNSQGGLEHVNRNVSSHIGETSAEKASLNANLPVSDIWGAIKPYSGVAAGDGDSEAKKQELESEELQSKKLAAYNKQINEQLENHSILPSEMSSKDRELVLKIKQKVDEQYPHLDKANHDKKVAQSYFLVKKCQDHPEKAPSMQLAAAIVAIPAIDFVGWLIGVLVAYKAAEDAPKIARILLDSEESYEYNELSKLEKKSHGDKNKSLLDSRPADFNSPNIDPDDFEPDEEGSRFEPNKEGNYDKVMRHEKFGKFYRDAKNQNTWYSKDRAGHGGEHWKKFIKEGDKLIHEADVDMTGKVMNKHKSDIGTKIKLKDLIG